MIEKIGHYSLTNPVTVYDEEALTALELAGRTAAKVNECVDQVNGIPEKIAQDVQQHIDSGEFDEQVDKYAGELKEQIDTAETRLEAQQDGFETRIGTRLNELDARMDTFTRLNSGSTTGDAELQDIRTWWNGNTSNNAGEAVRGQVEALRREAYQATANFGYLSWHKPLEFTIEVPRNNTHYCRVDFTGRISAYAKGGRYDIDFNETTCADLGDDVEITDASTATIYMGTYTALVYNITDMQLHFRKPTSNMQANDICLIKTAYAYPVGGTLFDEWCLQKLKAHEKSLAALEATEPVFTGDGAVQHYSGLFNGSGQVEKFLFFTDPHLCENEGWENGFFSYMGAVKKYHDVAPVDFVVCGGDWLGNGDTKAGACYKLGFIASQMRKMFPRYYPIVGNHDTNYQGVDDTGAANTGKLANAALRNLWFNEYGKNYYTFQGANTTFFVFDTDLDWDAYNGVMIPYYTEQLNWFMQEVEKTKGNIALLFHIAQVTDEVDRLHPLITNVTSYASGFNARHSDAKVRFAMCGHTHKDSLRTINGIPVVITTNLRDGGVASFDMCLADYTTNKLHLVRVGTGSHRTVNI